MIKYRIICPLNDNLTTFRVKCTEDDKLYIKKILDRPQFEIYKIIQEKDYDGVPKIKELFYSPENDKYILYEVLKNIIIKYHKKARINYVTK